MLCLHYSISAEVHIAVRGYINASMVCISLTFSVLVANKHFRIFFR